MAVSVKEQMRRYFSANGRKGGTARAAQMTPEERTLRARKAAQARWTQAKKKSA